MTMTTETESSANSAERYEPQTPFAETAPADESVPTAGFLSWAEASSPFAESGVAGVPVSEDETSMAEVYEELRDESFDEVLAELISETAEVVDQRIVGEGPSSLAGERERLGEAHLSPVAFEAEQVLDRMRAGLAGLDLSSLSEQQLEEVLERFEPAPAGLSPAGEEFLGGLLRKAKNVVRTVVRTAGKVAKAALPILGPILDRLKALVRPLLKRVLAIAISRLPGPLQEPARVLARRFGLGESAEAGDPANETSAESSASTPVAVGDPETLSESLDAALAEAVVHGGPLMEQGESFGYETADRDVAERHLETLTAARSELMSRLEEAGDGEDMAPAIEQFLPALLPALRLGISLVGRPKVVSFLANYLAGLIKQWVGPALAKPLSSAIVDIGLGLLTLEEPEPRELEGKGAPAVIASTIEDTVRRLSENEEYVFEDEDLLQLAAAEAFEQAVATHFPSQFLRQGLHQAPTLGGSFLPRHARRPYAYKRYSRVPEVEVTLPLAQSIRTFGGATLAASLAAAGVRLPARMRVHLFETGIGTTLPRLARLERVRGFGPNQRLAWKHFHPLTPEAAGLLLREPRLGVRVPAPFLQSRHRLAAGQRVYYLEPVDAVASGSAAVAVPRTVTATPAVAAAGTAAANGCVGAPSQGSATIDLVKSEVVLRAYFSEADAQAVASSVRAGRGTLPLLRALGAAYGGVLGSLGRPGRHVQIVKERTEEEDLLGPLTARVAPVVMGWLRQRLRGWTMTMLAAWARTRAQEFVRASDDARCGVTIVVTLRGVPGLTVVRQAIEGRFNPASLGGLSPASMFRGTPSATVAVQPGRHLR